MENTPKKVLFIDRDGTIIVEPSSDFQIDSLEKLEFLPKAISNLRRIAETLDYELVMVSNQDGLGTASFPEETFHPAHNKMLTTLENEGVRFAEIFIDRSFPHENKPTRKPGTAMLTQYVEGDVRCGGTRYDLARSFVIGDRATDVQLAQNLGCKAIYISSETNEASAVAALTTTNWDEIYTFLAALASQTAPQRTATVRRTTNETDIEITLNLDSSGNTTNDAGIRTGIGFFDHMLDQLARHSGCDLSVRVQGDLYIDEHHTIEDTGIALGEAFALALGDKRGIERYGFFLLPMDEALAQVAIDFSGRNWLVWDAPLTREKVGEVPTEMIEHFFKSFSDAAKCTLNVRATGANDHHIIEAIFKGWARAIKTAIRRDPHNNAIPSTKGML